jgi:hypothetical protein
VWHGFQVLEETVLEVVAEQLIGTGLPGPYGRWGLAPVEVHRQDLPWGRPPAGGAPWTGDAEMRRILDNLAFDM